MEIVSRGEAKATLDECSLPLSLFSTHCLFYLLKAHLSVSPEIRGGEVHNCSKNARQVYKAAELVLGLGEALLFSSRPAGSVCFTVSGLLPLSREASMYMWFCH